MQRSLLLVLSTLLIFPAIVVAMNKPLVGMDPNLPRCQGVTPGNDKIITHTDGHKYTLFYFYNSVYAYQIVKHSHTNQDTICVFNELNQFTTQATNETAMGSARCILTPEEFDTVRKIDAQRDALCKFFDLTEGQVCQAKKWLCQKIFTGYQGIIQNQIAAHDDSIRTAFVMGGRWQAFAKNYEQLINQTHTNLMRDIRKAKFQFYTLMCAGAALIVGGLYAGYQWYFGAQAEDEHDENVAESTDDTTEITQKSI